MPPRGPQLQRHCARAHNRMRKPRELRCLGLRVTRLQLRVLTKQLGSAWRAEERPGTLNAVLARENSQIIQYGLYCPQDS